jgi:hypothetical protein
MSVANGKLTISQIAAGSGVTEPNEHQSSKIRHLGEKLPRRARARTDSTTSAERRVSCVATAMRSG